MHVKHPHPLKPTPLWKQAVQDRARSASLSYPRGATSGATSGRGIPSNPWRRCSSPGQVPSGGQRRGTRTRLNSLTPAWEGGLGREEAGSGAERARKDSRAMNSATIRGGITRKDNNCAGSSGSPSSLTAMLSPSSETTATDGIPVRRNSREHLSPRASSVTSSFVDPRGSESSASQQKQVHEGEEYSQFLLCLHAINPLSTHPSKAEVP